MNDSLIPIGVVTHTFGIKGEIRVKTYSGEGRCLSPHFKIYLERPNGQIENHEIVSFRPFKDFFIIKLAEVKDLNSAELLVKSKVYVRREDLPPLEESEYYWIDLIGCKVFDLSNHYLGELKNIIETGGTDVFEIVSEEKELLIPFSKKFVLNIDLKEKKITVDATPFI